MADRRHRPDALRARNPRLVYTRCHAVRRRTALRGPGRPPTSCLMALGGLLSLGGYATDQPVRAFGDQAYLAAAQFAAIGTLLAVLSAEETGEGQFVDVSAQQSVVMAHENAVQFYDLERRCAAATAATRGRPASGFTRARTGTSICWRPGSACSGSELVAWLEAEGIEARRRACATKSWKDNEFALGPRRARPSSWSSSAGSPCIGRRRELYDAAKRHRLPLCPVNTRRPRGQSATACPGLLRRRAQHAGHRSRR